VVVCASHGDRSQAERHCLRARVVRTACNAQCTTSRRLRSSCKEHGAAPRVRCTRDQELRTRRNLHCTRCRALCSATCPVCTTCNPVCTTCNPVCTTCNPVCTTCDPLCTTSHLPRTRRTLDGSAIHGLRGSRELVCRTNGGHGTRCRALCRAGNLPLRVSRVVVRSCKVVGSPCAVLGRACRVACRPSRGLRTACNVFCAASKVLCTRLCPRSERVYRSASSIGTSIQISSAGMSTGEPHGQSRTSMVSPLLGMCMAPQRRSPSHGSRA
jgi:hypothetical protein